MSFLDQYNEHSFAAFRMRYGVSFFVPRYSKTILITHQTQLVLPDLNDWEVFVGSLGSDVGRLKARVYA